MARFGETACRSGNGGGSCCKSGYYLTLSEEIRGLTGYYFDEKKVKSASEKGYTLEKAQDLITYCNAKIEWFKNKSTIS